MNIRPKPYMQSILLVIAVILLLGLAGCEEKGDKSTETSMLDTVLPDETVDPVITGSTKNQSDIQVVFKPVDVGELSDYEDFLDWPHYAVISGIRADGSEAWSVITDRNYGLELSDWFSLGTADKLFYYTDYNTIFALDVKTGKSVWENNDMQKLVCSDNGFSDHRIGKNGELFICDGATDCLLVIDALGKTRFLSGLSDDLYVDAYIVSISYLDDGISVSTKDCNGAERQYFIPSGGMDTESSNQEGSASQARFFIKNVNSKLNIRALPQHESTLVGSLYDDTVMYFYGETDYGPGSDKVMHEWYKVVINQNFEGWVRSDLVKEISFS